MFCSASVPTSKGTVHSVSQMNDGPQGGCQSKISGTLYSPTTLTQPKPPRRHPQNGGCLLHVPELNKPPMQLASHWFEIPAAALFSVRCCNFVCLTFQSTSRKRLFERCFNPPSACNIAPQVSGPYVRHLSARVYAPAHE